MAVWYTIAGTSDGVGGTDLNTTFINFTITPIDPDTGIHSGAYLDYLNFTIGGGTEVDGSGDADTDTGIWSNGNIDSGVSKVQFTNLGIAGDINNIINAKVTFSSVSPTVDTSFLVDVDERTTNPISYSAGRNVCFFLRLPYDLLLTYDFYVGGAGDLVFTELSASGTITRTLTNSLTAEADGFYKYKFSGTITDYDVDHTYDVVRVLARRAFLGSSIDPLPGVGNPSFAIYDHHIVWPPNVALNLGDEYQSAYATVYTADTHMYNHYDDTLGMLPYAYRVDISINPLDDQIFIDHEAGDMCSLGHQFNLNINVFDPIDIEDNDGVAGEGGEAPTFTIRSVQVPENLGSIPGYQDICVRGTAGAEYTINLFKTASTTSSIPAATDAYFSFAGVGNFQTENAFQDNNFAIGSSGKNNHTVLIPRSSSEANYEFFIEPRGNTTLRSGVPSGVGQQVITQRGVDTITLTATPATANNWDLSPAVTQSFSRVRDTYGGKSNPADRHLVTVGECRDALSTGTKLTLRRTIPSIREGMYVMTPMNTNGIPHLTTVARVDRNVITLSASSTIAAGADVRFIQPSSRTIPFALAVPAGQGADSDFQDLSVQTGADYRPRDCVAGTRSGMIITAASAVSGATLIPINEKAESIRPGMVATIKGVSAVSGKGYLTVTGITTTSSVHGINLSEAVTLAEDQIITISEDPEATTTESTTGIYPVHTQADITTSHGSPAGSQEVGTISGYLDVTNLSGSVSLPVNIETVLKATEVS